jgi:hypothetical protein
MNATRFRTSPVSAGGSPPEIAESRCGSQIDDYVTGPAGVKLWSTVGGCVVLQNADPMVALKEAEKKLPRRNDARRSGVRSHPWASCFKVREERSNALRSSGRSSRKRWRASCFAAEP